MRTSVPVATKHRANTTITLAILMAASASSAATPPAAAPTPSPPAAAVTAPTYSGHGAESLPPALLDKFRPRPIAGDLSRRIQAMFDLRGPSAGRLTPDGKSLVFGWNVTGVPQLWRIDGPQRFPVQLTGGEDATVLAAITSDGKWLVVQRDRKGEENPGLYLLAPGGGPLIEVQHKAGIQTQFQHLSDDGRWLYYRANDRKRDSYAIYRQDLGGLRATPKVAPELLFSDDGLWSLSDVADDGRLLLQKSTGSLWAEYSEYDPGKRALTPLFGQNEKEEYDAIYGARLGGGGQSIIVRTNKPGEFRRLYRFESGKLLPVGEELKANVDTFHIDDHRTRILYEVNDGGYYRLRALDARTWKPLVVPTLPAADNVYLASMSADGRYATVGVDDGLHPLRSFVIDWQKSTAEPWHLPSTPEIDTTRFVRAALESYPARDGTPIPALVRRPASCERALCPVVVSFHGGPESQTRPGFNAVDQLFVDAGFVFVEPNVRGSDGYGKGWLRADDGPKRLAVITDIEDAARWARTRFAQGKSQPRVGILGGSYGGYSVLMGMTMFAGAYDAGVDVVGISNLATFLRNTAPYRRALRISEYGDPDKDAEALTKLSPMTYVDRVKAPLLIIQGASDPRVPAGEAVQIHDALAARKIPVELMIFPDEGHGAQKRENRVVMYGHALGFFERYLK